MSLRAFRAVRLASVVAAAALAACSGEPAPAQAESSIPAPPPPRPGGGSGGLPGNDTPSGAKGTPYSCLTVAKQAQENCLRSAASAGDCGRYQTAVYRQCAYGN